MPHIQAKQDTNLPLHLTVKSSPVDVIPVESYICGYGVDTLTAGASSEIHIHDCEVWWIIVNGNNTTSIIYNPTSSCMAISTGITTIPP